MQDGKQVNDDSQDEAGSRIYVDGTRGPVSRAIRGALCTQIHEHGPIQEYHLRSAVKRVFGALKTYNHNLKQRQHEREVKSYYKSIGVELREKRKSDGPETEVSV